jgi:aminocarboxymuconate-semialdehyde decarboxylase
MRAVDVHAHVIVPELLREAAPAEGWRPAIRAVDGRRVVEFEGRTISSARGAFVDVDEILAERQRIGVDRVVLCPWVPLLFYDVPSEEALRRCRLQNDGLAELRARRPDRVAVLAAVPLQDPELAARELTELMGSGTFAGVEVAASVAGVYLGDRRFEPFWTAAEAAGALVFVHPTTRGFPVSALDEYYLHNLVGNPIETTLTAAHMVMAGVVARHPSLNVLLAHGGGALVALRGRLGRGQEAVAAAGPDLGEPADVSVRRFLFDTVTHDSGALRALVEAVGPGRVLLGSDHPFDMADPSPVDTVRRAGLGRDAEEAVLFGNAERLFGFDRAVAA